MEYYRQSAAQVCRALNSSEDGISASQAMQRLQTKGKNCLEQPPGEGCFQRFLKQMADPMTLVLLAAAAVSWLTAVCAGQSSADVVIILAVVLINAMLGVIQENKAEKAIEALQQMTAAHSQVLRDGTLRVLPSEELVPGDVVQLSAGDAVPADGRLIQAAQLRIEESALTGESVPAAKSTAALPGSAALGDRSCMVYMGSTVNSGRGLFVVTETGMDTEMGKIAGVLNCTVQGKTPLQLRLAVLSRTLSGLVLAICGFIFVFSLWRAEQPGMNMVLSCFMTAVSLAVAAVPEGLAAVVTIVLSMGVTKMSRRGAVIRRLTAVETLGCAQVICSDKTGTLTQNKMTVCEVYGEKQPLEQVMTLCSDACSTGDGRAEGEPTECALLEYAMQQGVVQSKLAAEFPRIAELPFDSERKRMSTFHRQRGRSGIVQLTKGAPDLLLERCSHILKNGRVVPLTPDLRQEILQMNRQMAGRALRVLAAARREWAALPAALQPETAERELVFLGLAGMMDPIRPEAKQAIGICREAGVKPVMITGDHRDTAAAIGRQLGILTGRQQVVTGAELDRISDETLKQRVPEYGVYARVQPQHKARIVKAWQSRGCVVAMAGDGANDAPALKTADIGVGMGISGTDVTRSVADMVLVDDNFATIVSAVEEGRRIYDNIRKAVQFLLASNLSEVVSIFCTTLMGITLLNPAQLLWINLVTDCFPALALGMEKAQPGLMQRPPRKKEEGIFEGGLGFDVFWQGLMVTALTLFSYFVGVYWQTGSWVPMQCDTGAAMAFLTMSMAELFHSFNLRSRRQSLLVLRGQNWWLWLALAAGALLTISVMIWPPAAAAFGFPVLMQQQYIISLALAAAVIPLAELAKCVLRKIYQEK